MDEYGKLLTDYDSAQEQDDGIEFKHFPLSQLKPVWFTTAAKIRRWSKATMEIARRMVAKSRTRVDFVEAGKQASKSPPKSEIELDFHHVFLQQRMSKGLHEAAKYYNVTINTLFSAALVRYLGQHQKGRHSYVVYTIAVSLRKLLGVVYTKTFRSYMVDCTLRVPHALETRELLSLIETKTASARGSGLDAEIGRMESAVSLFCSRLPRSLVLWIMGRTQGTNVLYSNPGIIEEDFTSFGSTALPISEMTIFGYLVPPYDLMFHTPMIDKKLQLDVVYRSSCFSDIRRQFVDPFLDQVQRIIAESQSIPVTGA